MSAIRPDVHVVAAGRQDAAAVAAVHARLFDQPWDEQSVASLLDHPAALAFLANTVGDGAIVGFIIAHAAVDEAEIVSIGVALKWQRRGVARLLVKELAEAAAANGAKRLYLDVAADNRPAIALYAGLGFIETGRRRNYYLRPGAPATDALVLAKAL